MITYELIDFLQKNRIKYEKITEGRPRVRVKCCAFGDNFYDYGENPPKKYKFDKRFDTQTKNKFNEFRQKKDLVIMDCESCCACGGW